MRGLAVAMLAMGLSLGLGAALFAHPLLALGAWQDAEPAAAAAAIGAALCAIGLMAILWLDSRRAAALLLSPFILPLAAIGLWGLVTVAWARFPGAALLGTPQTGQGPLWFFGAWIFLASAQVLRPHRRVWRTLVTVAIIVALVTALGNLPLTDLPAAQLAGSTLGWLGPFFRFNDHLAYPGLVLLGLALWWRPRRSVMTGVLFGTALLVLAVSQNGTAGAAAMVMVVIALVPAHFIRERKWAVIGLVLAAHLAPTAALRLGAVPQEQESLSSRTILVRLLEQDWRDAPWTLVAGNGWGQVQDVFSRNQWHDSVADAMPGWIDIRRDEFHSHSAAVEALFAGGALALALWLVFIARLPLSARRQDTTIALACVVGWALLDAMWFPMPQAFPYLALMLSAVTAAGPTLYRRWMKPILLAVLGAASIGQIAFAARTISDGLAWREVRTCLAVQCRDIPPIPKDPRGLETGLAATVAGRWNPSLIALASRRAEILHSIVLDAALASRYARRAGLAGSLTAEQARDWRAAVERSLAVAPWRWPIPAPYADWLASKSRSDDLAALLALWRPLAPTEPLVQWFDGMLLVLSDDPADQRRGVDLMRTALARDSRHHIEVADDLRAMLESRP